MTVKELHDCLFLRVVSFPSETTDSSKQVPQACLGLWISHDGHHDWPHLAPEWHEPLLSSLKSISLVVTLKCVCLRAFLGTALAMPSTIWCLQALYGITWTEAIPRSWQRHAGIWDVPPHSITCFLPPGGHDFPSEMPVKAICNIGPADTGSFSEVQPSWGLSTDLIILLPPYCIPHSVPKHFFCSCFLPTSHTFPWYPHINMCGFMGLQDKPVWKGPQEA